VVDHPALNHRPEVLAGIMATDATAILREFFESRREQGQTGASAAGDETCR
jgi:hypothetical protein